MKRIIVIFSLSIAGFPVTLLAQKKQTPIQQAEKTVTEKFPSTRFLNLEYEMLSPTDYSSKIKDEEYEGGRIKTTHRYIGNINYPINVARRLSITPSVRYEYQSFELENVENNSINYPSLYHSNNIESHFIYAAVKTTYISSLFNKPMVYTFNLTLDASDKGYEHMAANLLGLMVLKKDANTTFTLGLVASFDKTLLIPVFPLISYEHRFRNSQWCFDMFFPKHIHFRRPMFTNGRLSLGTELNKNRFFGHPEITGLEDSYNVVRRELKTGLIYEHYLNKNFIVSLRGGVVNTVDWKISTKTSRKTIINFSPNMNMYFNVGFSYNL